MHLLKYFKVYSWAVFLPFEEFFIRILPKFKCKNMLLFPITCLYNRVGNRKKDKTINKLCDKKNPPKLYFCHHLTKAR